MTSWKHCSLQKLISQAQIPNSLVIKNINELFKKYNELFLQKNITRDDWVKRGWYKYGSNPEKFILTHVSFPEYIFKLINPQFVKQNDSDSEKLIRMNLSRVFVAREIRKYSIKWVFTPVKYVCYIEVLNQWIVVAQKLNEEDMKNTDKKLKALDQEHLDELFFVCEKVGFYDIDPRNLAILKSFEGDKIYIIDTENAQEVTEENEQELRENMIKQFNLFLKNYLDPYISPRYERRYSLNPTDLELTSPSVLLHPDQQIHSKKMISMWENMGQKMSGKSLTPTLNKTGRIDYEKLSMYDHKSEPQTDIRSLRKKFGSMKDLNRAKEEDMIAHAPVDNLLLDLKARSPISPRDKNHYMSDMQDPKQVFKMDPNWTLDFDNTQ